MARRVPRAAPAGELRAHLLAERIQFRVDYGLEPILWKELSKAVDALAGGQPYRLHRWELPDDHPQAWPAGDPCDELVLGADDTLTTIR
jgi:hypothetical protein